MAAEQITYSVFDLMKLGQQILKLLGKQYAPSTMVQTSFGRYDLAFKTDEQGRPVLLFLGKADADGHIKGERFARTIITAPDGKVIKDHWDNKGKITS
jgi:hypothetical protein